MRNLRLRNWKGVSTSWSRLSACVCCKEGQKSKRAEDLPTNQVDLKIDHTYEITN